MTAPAADATLGPSPGGLPPVGPAPVDRALVDRVRSRLAREGAQPTPATLAAALRAEAGLVREAALLPVLAALQRELVGAGPLEPLLREPGTTDVLVDAAGTVWVDRGDGLVRTDVRLPDPEEVRRLASRLVAPTGRRLDDAAPFVDARLADGTRLHAVLPPVAVDGPLLSLRVPPSRPPTLEDLQERGSVDGTGAALLRRLVVARCAFVVTGGTGSGKTTLLATLLGLVPPTERVLVVEDSPELAPDHPHVVRLSARPPNLEGAGEVTVRDCVRQALRMRPDRLVVGEVRGAEVVELLAALNTGHDGGCGTVHAGRGDEVPARLEALALAAGLPRPALHAQLAAALRVVVHLDRPAGRRRVAQVLALERGHDGLVTAGVAWRAAAGTSSPALQPGPAAAALDRLLEGGSRP